MQNIFTLFFNSFLIFNFFYIIKVTDCLIPEKRKDQNAPINFAISYCKTSPDAKMLNITEGGVVGSLIKCYDYEKLDNPLATRINSITIEKHGKFCFIVYDIFFYTFPGRRV